MSKNNNKTVQLLDTYQKFMSDIDKLVSIQKKLKDILFQLEQSLLISRRLLNKLNKLYTLVFAANAILLALSPIPYVGAVAKPLQKIVGKIKSLVSEARNRVKRIENKIKPHRKKLAEFREYITQMIQPIVKVENFITEEKKLLNISYEANKNLPKSRYKNLLLDRLNNTSGVLDGMMTTPMELISNATNTLSEIQILTKQIDELCDLVATVIKPVVEMTDELDRVTGNLKNLNTELDRTLTVNLGVTRSSLSIGGILKSASGTPGINLLIKMAEEILAPILGSLGLKVVKIPGLEGRVSDLEKVSEKLDVIDGLKKSVQEQLTALTTKENPQTNFKSIDV